jgi:hypothetical protein
MDNTDIVNESELAKICNVTNAVMNAYRQTGLLVPFLFKAEAYCLYKLSEVLPLLAERGKSEKVRTAAKQALALQEQRKSEVTKIFIRDFQSRIAEAF